MQKIMVVDDDEGFVDIIKKVLEKEGFTVISALSGNECLEKLAVEVPDLILLDIMMPEMDGYKVIDRIREKENTKTIPVAMVTALAAQGDQIKGFEETDIVGYITKPFRKEELVSTVKWLLRNLQKG